MTEVLNAMNYDNLSLAVETAEVPEHIRGYGHIREAAMAKARAVWSELLSHWRQPAQRKAA